MDNTKEQLQTGLEQDRLAFQMAFRIKALIVSKIANSRPGFRERKKYLKARLPAPWIT